MGQWDERFPLAFYEQDVQRAEPVIAEARHLISRGEEYPEPRPAALERALDIAAVYRSDLQTLLGDESGNPLQESTGSLRTQIRSDLERLDRNEAFGDDDLFEAIMDKYERLIELSGRVTELAESWTVLQIYVELTILKAESEELDDSTDAEDQDFSEDRDLEDAEM